MLSLIQKYLNGKTSPDEEKELLRWVHKSEANQKVFADHVKLWSYMQKKDYNFDEEKALRNIRRKTGAPPSKKHGFAKRKAVYRYAAILIAVLLSFYFYTDLIYKNEKEPGITGKIKGQEKNSNIILTRHDGTEKIISHQKKELSYLSSTKEDDEQQLIYHTLQVPRGRIFKIVLSDSTRIWLNAETRIKYPEKFVASEQTRTIYLEGEAFFEVAHNSEQPFIVKSGQLEIEVLGTRFNVSSYDSGTHINTTLIEGAVKISNPHKPVVPVILKPSQQAAYNKSTLGMEVFNVDPDIFTAWVDKRVVFDNKPFTAIILEIERTYNVDIINRLPQLEQQHFTGEFDGESMDEILKTMSSSIHFNYKTENGKIIIY